MKSLKWIGTAGGLTAFLFGLITLRRWHRRWGTSGEIRRSTFQGDSLIPAPRYQTTHAIEIRAVPEAIWPWLVQMGESRGGFYSFDRLENAAGMSVQSADRIDPALQSLAVGDVVPLSALGGPTVVILEPGKTMVLHFVMDPFTGKPIEKSAAATRWFDWTWTFALQTTGTSTTRLVIRTRADYAPWILLAPIIAVLLEPVHFIMERQMLLGIKRRAEHVAAPR